MGIGIHAVTNTRRDVLDEAQAEGTAAVLVALELGDGGLGRVGAVEADNTASARAAARFILNLCLLDLTDGLEEFDEIVVACRPGKLGRSQQSRGRRRKEGVRGDAYIANEDGVALLNTGRGVVGEGVRLHRSVAGIEGSTAAGRAAGAAEPTATAAITAHKAPATDKSTPATKAACKASAYAEPAPAVAASTHARTSEAILADLKNPALPVIAVVLLDGVPSIIGRLEYHNARALGSAVGTKMDVGANNAACAGCPGVNNSFHLCLVGPLTALAEKVL